MRCVIAILTIWIATAALAGCVHHEDYVSPRAIDEMPAKMLTLKPGMTTSQILDALNAPNVKPIIGGGDERNYHWNYPLQEGSQLILFYNLTSSKNTPFKVVLNTPSGSVNKNLQQ